jgi:ABC-type dipeptide/oligopeptide/nickel transport system ATPase component
MNYREVKLSVNNLKISFRTDAGKVQAVRDISFDMERGETLCIVGESGSGKSVTSRAILGILAGNAIVESGSILYGGQDLLQISEDDFHKIRGDKIAMIFQDPLSSLNPIVKIGKQLTEAMILKNRASRKAAAKEFKFLLSELRTAIVAAMELKGVSTSEASAKVDKFLETFKKFTLVSIKLEDSYNESKSALAQAKDEADFFLLNYEKKQKMDFNKSLKALCKHLAQVKDGFILKGELADAINGVLASKDVDAAARRANRFGQGLGAVDLGTG